MTRRTTGQRFYVDSSLTNSGDEANSPRRTYLVSSVLADEPAFPHGKGELEGAASTGLRGRSTHAAPPGLRPSLVLAPCVTSSSGPFAKRAGRVTHALVGCVVSGLA